MSGYGAVRAAVPMDPPDRLAGLIAEALAAGECADWPARRALYWESDGTSFPHAQESADDD